MKINRTFRFILLVILGMLCGEAIFWLCKVFRQYLHSLGTS